MLVFLNKSNLYTTSNVCLNFNNTTNKIYESFFKSLGIYDVKNIFNILYKLFVYFCILLIILCCFINILLCLTLPVRNVLKTGRVWASFSPIRFAGKTQQQHLLPLNPPGPFVHTGYPRRPDATPAKR